VVGAFDEYLAAVRTARRAALGQLRDCILSLALGGDEVVRRSVPAFRYRG
jgi:hypothetical protein